MGRPGTNQNDKNVGKSAANLRVSTHTSMYLRVSTRKMRSKMRTQCEDASAKCEGNPNLCKQNSIVATLFRSKIICTVRIRIGSFVLNVPQSLHQSSMTYIDTNAVYING